MAPLPLIRGTELPPTESHAHSEWSNVRFGRIHHLMFSAPTTTRGFLRVVVCAPLCVGPTVADVVDSPTTRAVEEERGRLAGCLRIVPIDGDHVLLPGCGGGRGRRVLHVDEGTGAHSPAQPLQPLNWSNDLTLLRARARVQVSTPEVLTCARNPRRVVFTANDAARK